MRHILLDEPTSNLDSLNEAVILKPGRGAQGQDGGVGQSPRLHHAHCGPHLLGREREDELMAAKTPAQKARAGKQTVGLMIELYCHGHHGTRGMPSARRV